MWTQTTPKTLKKHKNLEHFEQNSHKQKRSWNAKTKLSKNK